MIGFILLVWRRMRCAHVWATYQVHGDARLVLGRFRQECRLCGCDRKRDPHPDDRVEESMP